MRSAAPHRHDGEPALVPIRRRAFAFDMDGVVYRGPELIPGAAEAVAAVQQLGLPALFITNNSRETPVELAAKLQGLGINAGPESIVSAVVASVSYLRTPPSDPLPRARARQRRPGGANRGGRLRPHHLGGRRRAGGRRRGRGF